jgi:hypothetical protein
LHIRAKITKAWLVKNLENNQNQTSRLLVGMTEKLPALAQCAVASS